MKQDQKKLLGKIKELTTLKLQYYYAIGLENIHIESIIEDVFLDLYEYMPECDYLLDTISVQEALILMLGGKF